MNHKQIARCLQEYRRAIDSSGAQVEREGNNPQKIAPGRFAAGNPNSIKAKIVHSENREKFIKTRFFYQGRARKVFLEGIE